MRILIVDDSIENQESAKKRLRGHEVDVVSSFDAAEEQLVPGAGEKYDVLMCDLKMPMSAHHGIISRDSFNPNKQIAYGWSLALRAVGAGIKKIMVLTNLSHHDDAESASLDLTVLAGNPFEFKGLNPWNCGYSKEFRPTYIINGAKVVFTHAYVDEKNCKVWDSDLKDLIGEDKIKNSLFK